MYYEQMYVKNFGNLDEMDKFSETFNIPRLSHKEIENMYRPIMSKKIESVV